MVRPHLFTCSEKTVNSPVISVVMSVYNGEPYLSEAIESILNQTFRDFEFIIINDGSTDVSWTTIQRYAEQDQRIVAVMQENTGLTKSLHKGIKLAKGDFIARQDADDVSLPERFGIQVEYLNKHAEVALLGTDAWIIREGGFWKRRVWVETDPMLLAWELVFNNCFVHTSVMIRKSALTAASLNYGVVLDAPEEVATSFDPFGPAQDYLLFGQLNLSERVAQINDVLVKKRDHSQAISYKAHEQQLRRRDKISKILASILLGTSVSKEGMDQIRKTKYQGTPLPKQGQLLAEQVYQKLIKLKGYNETARQRLRKRMLLLQGDLRTYLWSQLESPGPQGKHELKLFVFQNINALKRKFQ